MTEKQMQKLKRRLVREAIKEVRSWSPQRRREIEIWLGVKLP